MSDRSIHRGHRTKAAIGARANAVHSVRARIGARAIVIAVGFVAAGSALVTPAQAANPRYTDLRRLQPVQGNAQAGAKKSAVCLACHGADGVSVAPTFPRLAGQRVDYLYHRLYSFRHADPKDPYYSISPMTSIAANLSDTDMRDLATYFASRTPITPPAPDAPPPPDAPPTPDAPPAAGAPPAAAAPPSAASTPSAATSVDRGADLFAHGNPARGMPPCQGCHGADANGLPTTAGQYAAYPALRGQYALYVVARLTNYRDGKPSDTSNTFIMHGVAATLDDESIQALSAWLESLAPAKSL